METITDSLGSQKIPLSMIQRLVSVLRLKARLRLEQRLLRSKDGSELWCGHLSSEIIVEIILVNHLVMDRNFHRHIANG
jgi:hypothetical protein